jgi:two-component system NtrC family sensor kinase
VSVQDTGCGMVPAVQAWIFEAFYTTKPTGEGSGLGLDIVNRIVEKHHGAIRIESAVGQGSRFTVRLPSGALSLQ